MQNFAFKIAFADEMQTQNQAPFYEIQITNFLKIYYPDKKYFIDVKQTEAIENNVAIQKFLLDIYIDKNDFDENDEIFLKSAILAQIYKTENCTLNIYRIPFSGLNFSTNLQQQPKTVQQNFTPSPPREEKINTVNFEKNNFYFLFIIIFAFLVLAILLFTLFLIFYLIQMNKKINFLIFENYGLKKNLLLVNNSENFSTNEIFPIKENTSDDEISNILKEIEKLNSKKLNKVEPKKNALKIKKQPQKSSENDEVFQAKNKKIEFEDLKKFPEQLLFILFKDFDLNVLSAAIWKSEPDFVTKIFKILTFNQQNALKFELEKFDKMQILNPETQILMQQKIVDYVTKLIDDGKLELEKFF